MLDGYISRREKESLYSIVTLKDLLREKGKEGIINFLRQQNTRYIIHYKFLVGEAFSHELAGIPQLLDKNVTLIYNDTKYSIYRIIY